MQQEVNLTALKTQILLELVQALSTESVENQSASISIPVDRLMEMLSNAAKPISGFPVTAGTVGYNPTEDPYREFIGQKIFFRGGIFAYCMDLVEVTQNELIGTNVVWLADAGDLDKLLFLKPGEHIDSLSGVKSQYYKPTKRVILAKSLISDVHAFDGEFYKK